MHLVWRLRSRHDRPMIRLWIVALTSLFRSRTDLIVENLALRQQLAICKARRPRTRFSMPSRFFWVLLSRTWSKWQGALVLVKPETVVRWHRLGFRAYWRWKSRKNPPGRPKIDPELRDLIRRLAKENPTWGAPRVHAELLKLGFEVAERTVSRYLPKKPTNPEVIKRWKTFLKQHRKALVGMDFFTVNTLTFRTLYVLFLVHHERRRIVYWAVTESPTFEWVRQQIRQAFPYDSAPSYLILDRDPLFGRKILEVLRSVGTEPVRISPRSPWQNGIAERWVGSVRRELLHHVIVLGEHHLRQLLSCYIDYYHEDRPHLALAKDSPASRPTELPTNDGDKILAFLRCDGLHHRYAWEQAA